MDLLSIGPATKTVALGRAAVEVSGLSLRKLTSLVRDHPALLSFVGDGTIDTAALVSSGSEMALAMFGMGVIGPAKQRWGRAPTDENLMTAFDAAAAGQQIDILATIVDLTFKGERGAPFLQSVIGALSASREPATDQPMTPESSTPTSSND
jgi:hypothetical protein